MSPAHCLLLSIIFKRNGAPVQYGSCVPSVSTPTLLVWLSATRT